MERLLLLLEQTRRLNNQTVRNAHEVETRHKAVDKVLAEHGDKGSFAEMG